jgi:hypothetical protein
MEKCSGQIVARLILIIFRNGLLDADKEHQQVALGEAGYPGRLEAECERRRPGSG